MSEMSPGQLATVIKSSRPTYFDEDEETQAVSSKLSNWATGDNKTFFPTTKPVGLLVPGVYEIKNSQSKGTFFNKIPVNVEGLIQFEDSVFSKVVSEITKFWESEQLYRKYGLMYKRGIFLYGPPGSGKTSLIQIVMNDVIKRGGVVIKFDNPNLFPDGVRVLREIQPKTPIIVLMEDIEAIIEYWSESDVLNILDGVNRVDKVIYLATSNFPEKLGDRIINRPSRFDKRFHVAHPSERDRAVYLKHLVKVGGGKVKIDIKKWVADTENMSISHIKELFTAVLIIGDKYEDAIKTLRSMKEEKPSSEEDKLSKLGFSSN